MIVLERKYVKLNEVAKNYVDDGEGGVFAYDNHVTVRPPYQREFIYSETSKAKVIDSVLKRCPINPIYWNKTGEDSYEILDGQQRTISICQYMTDCYPVSVNGNNKFYHNLSESEKEIIDNYEMEVYVCEGDESDRVEWFDRINIPNYIMSTQEKLNNVYHGSWLDNAKPLFSRVNCEAVIHGAGFMKGSSNRQEYLEKAIQWIADRDGVESVEEYMAIHQHDEDANDLWVYYQDVINWAKRTFTKPRKGITDTQKWGLLYNKYRDERYNTNQIEEDVRRLIADDDVTKKSGIIPYLLSGKTEEKHLSIRAFTESQKLRAYERQNHKCACCGEELPIDKMEGDHITPWSEGGRTIDENLQMLCVECNRRKGTR